MNPVFLAWLTLIGTSCWIVCFWWMHRISSRQDAMLKELQQQGRRIERLSKAEHDLIKDIHPKVESIGGDMNDVALAVKAKGRVTGFNRIEAQSQ